MGVVPAVLLSVALAADAASEPPQAQAEPAPVPAASKGMRVWLAGGATTGTAPKVTPRLGVGLALDLAENLTVEAQLETGVPALFPGGPTAAAGYQLWPACGGTLALCTMLPIGPMRVLVCPIAQLDAVESTGLGVSNPGAGVAAWFALGIDARALVDLTDRFFLHVAGGERVAVIRPTVVFEHFKTVWESPLFSSSLEGGVGVRW
jgi:hypothetical protein